MKYKKGIFCIEGIWDEGDLKNKISVLPMLDLLKRGGYCDYIYHDCATLEELKFFLKKWKQKKYKMAFPILYFAFHGNTNCILLANNKKVELDDISELLKDSCERTVIFFASCETISTHKANVNRFLKNTQAIAAIGYKSEVDWIKATAFEMLIFEAIQRHSSSKRGLIAFEKIINKEFGGLKRDLKFEMVLKK